MNPTLFHRIALALSLFIALTNCTPHGELKVGTIDSTRVENNGNLITTETIITIDSLQYPEAVVATKDKLYLTGFTFTGGNTRYSVIVCVDPKKKSVDWQKTIYTHPSVELDNISIIDGRLFVTGFGGVSGVVKDSLDRKIADPIDLNPIIISVALDGSDYRYKEIEGDNPHAIGSKIVKHHDKLYMSYAALDEKDWGRISKTETKIVELSDDLDVVRSESFFDGIITRQQLVSFKNKLYLTGLHGQTGNQLKGFEFKHDLTVKHFPLHTENYEFHFTSAPGDSRLHLMSIGYPGENRNGQIIREFMFNDKGWVESHQCSFTDGQIRIQDNVMALDGGKTMSIVSRENRIFSLVELNGSGIKEMIRFKTANADELYLKDLIIAKNGTPYVVANNNDKTSIYTLNQ
jgi:hypothetical protein